MLELTQKQGMYQLCWQTLAPSLMILQDLSGILPNELEEKLKEILDDLKTREPTKHVSGNFFFNPSFASYIRSERSQNLVLSNPKLKARCNGDSITVERTFDYFSAKRVLSNFKSPNGSPKKPENCFTKKLTDELDWIYQRQQEIAQYILEKQAEAITSGRVERLVKLTQDDVGKAIGLHETTVNKLLKDVAIQVKGHSLYLADLITPFPEGIKVRKKLMDQARAYGGFYKFFENHSDEEIRVILAQEGVEVPRRTLCKYKQEILGGEFGKPRRCADHIKPEQHWYLDRPLKEEDLEAIVLDNLSREDCECLATPNEDWKNAELRQTKKGYEFANLPNLPTANLLFFYIHKSRECSANSVSAIREEIDRRAEKTGYSAEHLDYSRNL